MYTTLISCSQLAKKLHSNDTLIIDCRFRLTDADAGRMLYLQSHIPGAYYLHLDTDLSSEVTPVSGRHPLPSPKTLSQKLKLMGLNKISQVVVYDDLGGAIAGRVWWLLRWLGHDQVALLDGGFSEWLNQNLTTDSEIVKNLVQGDFASELAFDAVVTLETLVSEHPYTLVDARAPERYSGAHEPLDKKAGHIPGALNRPLDNNLDSGCFKRPEQLKKEWLEVLNGRKPEQIVHQCGSGVTACHNQLAMEIAGLHGSKLYPGSWSEWIQNDERAIATKK